MKDNNTNQNAYRTFQLMGEIEGGEAISQRELASRLGIAVGLVNSYLKNFVAKGYIRVKTFPRNRYAYLLTPKGIAEKSRLAYQHLNYFTSLYTVTRQDYAALFQSLRAEGVKSVAFCGVDEVAEIAYLSLREAGIDLAVVMDDDLVRERFFGEKIATLADGLETLHSPIVITSLKKAASLRGKMLDMGVDPEIIFMAAGADLDLS